MLSTRFKPMGHKPKFVALNGVDSFFWLASGLNRAKRLFATIYCEQALERQERWFGKEAADALQAKVLGDDERYQ